jgi:hypothetical protein
MISIAFLSFGFHFLNVVWAAASLIGYFVSISQRWEAHAGI